MRTNPRGRFNNFTGTTHFSVLASQTRQKAIGNGLHKVFRNNCTTAFSKLFPEFDYIISDKTAFSLKGLALVAYSIHTVLLTFSDLYKRWQVQRRLILVAHLLIELAAEQQGDDNKIAEVKFFYWYSSSAVV